MLHRGQGCERIYKSPLPLLLLRGSRNRITPLHNSVQGQVSTLLRVCPQMVGCIFFGCLVAEVTLKDIKLSRSLLSPFPALAPPFQTVSG